MRKLSIALLTAAAVVMAAGVSSAVEVQVFLTDRCVQGNACPNNLGGANNSNNIGAGAVNGNELLLDIGDLFSVQAVVTNASGDVAKGLFMSLSFDNNVVSPDPALGGVPGGTNVGVRSEVLSDIGPGTNTPIAGLTGLGSIQHDPGDSLNTLRMIGHTQLAGAAGNNGQQIAAAIVFTAMGGGSTNIDLIFQPGDDAVINDISGPAGQALVVNLGGASVTVVPEPGTALLLGLGLVGLSTAGRRVR